MTSLVTDRYGIILQDKGSAVGLPLESMVRPALRRNPRRAQLLVSTVLGKHLPVDPRVVAGIGRLLGALVSRCLDDDRSPVPESWLTAASAAVTGGEPGALLDLLTRCPVVDRADVLTVGFAETATALGHLVADQVGSRYLHSTRNRTGEVPVAAEFSEPHSHATAHLLRPAPAELLDAGTVVLVDDELSTGTTALNVLEVLHAIRPRDRYVLAGLLDVRSDEADAQRAGVAERLGCRIDVVALLRGSVAVPDDAAGRIATDLGPADLGPAELAAADLGPADSPPVAGPSSQEAGISVLSLRWPVGVPLGGAHGFLPSQRAAFDAAVTDVAGRLDADIGAALRVLVIGTEEFMYLPLRVALALTARSGRVVAYQSTTRSPVHAVDEPDYPIRRRIEFWSSVDGGPHTERRFVYNADWPGEGPAAEADAVLIVSDGSELTGPAGIAGAVAAGTGARVILAEITPETAR